ncbi:cupin domain-containing protein [Yinghuangia aomiensis]
MSINDIRTVLVDGGDAVVPDWPPGEASPDWKETEYRGFASADGRLFGGGWEGTGGTLRLDPYPYDEVCVMVSGRVALIDLDGNRREFGAGEAFFVPKGFRGTWETLEPSRKFFIAYDPTA